jgi:hypothetical protein
MNDKLTTLIGKASLGVRTENYTSVDPVGDMQGELHVFEAVFENRADADALFDMFANWPCDSGSDRNGENSRSEVECEASQSGAEGNRP